MGLKSGETSRLGLAAATVVKTGSGVIGTIIVTTGGTVSVNDTSTLGGVAASNLVFTKTAAVVGDRFELNFPMRLGIVVTPSVSAVVSVSYE